MIYFDNAATYVADNRDVLNAYFEAIKEYPANASSSHRLGYLTNAAISKARLEVLKLLKLSSDYEVIFNSGASEGINQAIKGYALRNKTRGNEIISFVNEHAATLQSLKCLEQLGFKIIYISSSEKGVINYQELKEKINHNTIMVIAMSVNNEVGSVNDIAQIAKIVKEYPKCVFFSDVTQSIGKIDINYNLLDMFAFSAHKFGGLIGSGVLIKKKKILLKKIIDGGEQENNYRAGTEPTPLILSTVFALKKALKNLEQNYNYVSNLYQNILCALKNNEEIIINSYSGFPYILNFSLKSKKASVVIEALSNEEIYISSLSACNSRTNKISNVLMNMHLDKRLSENSIRLSFSHINTMEETIIFTKKLDKILKELR